jgi:hypothetical protein
MSPLPPSDGGPLRKLLVIAFHYPPDNTSTGVLRTFKFTEYLLRHRWRSRVISVPEHLYASRNPAGADVIPPEIEVERVWACDIKSAAGFRGIYPAWLAVPDRYWPWLFAGTRAGARAIRAGGIDAIYSTYPVPTAHLIGLRLKRRFGLPWIADFRDPWVEESMPPLRHRFEAKLEHAVVTHADRVICNTPAMRCGFLRTYPDVPAAKFVTITNGYDEADLAGIVPEHPSTFLILYPGVIDAENRNPLGLLRAVRLALDRGWLDARDLRIEFLGAGSYGESTQFRRDVEETGLGSVVHVVVDRIPYRRALARVAGADVVVVLSENLADEGGDRVQSWTSMQVPVKVYEYLRLGRPMLALVSGGAVQELLETIGGFSVFPPRDAEKVAQALRQHYAARTPARAELPSPTASVAAYSRENLTGLLAAELDAIRRPHA